jgi:hypothetical protein
MGREYKYIVVSDNGDPKELIALITGDWYILSTNPTANAVHYIITREVDQNGN